MKKYNHLTHAQRYTISILCAKHWTLTKIAEALNVSVSTISRELRRNRTKTGHYNPDTAHQYARIRAERLCNHKIKEYIKKRVLRHLIEDEWSPQQIAGRLAQEGIKISYETIYKWIRADKRAGGTLYLHCHHRLKRKKRPVGKAPQIKNRVSIHDRPPEVDTWRFADWEMDTIIGKNGHEAIVTLVERKTNYLLMKRLPMGKNAKALAEVVKWLLFPFKQHVLTITTDNGSEFAEHEKIARFLKAKIYFADPYASWQKGCIENTNKLIRQYIPKGMSFSELTDEQIAQIQQKINNRPRLKLNFMTPLEAFYQQIR